MLAKKIHRIHSRKIVIRDTNNSDLLWTNFDSSSLNTAHQKLNLLLYHDSLFFNFIRSYIASYRLIFCTPLSLNGDMLILTTNPLSPIWWHTKFNHLSGYCCVWKAGLLTSYFGAARKVVLSYYFLSIFFYKVCNFLQLLNIN